MAGPTTWLLSALACLALCLPAVAQVPEGRWKIGQVRFDGSVHTGESLELARSLAGGEVLLAEGRIKLYDGTVCPLGEPVHERLEDGLATFGSHGGSWSLLGIQADEHQAYPVVRQPLACLQVNDPVHHRPADIPTHELLIANDGALVLMNVWEMWVELIPTVTRTD